MRRRRRLEDVVSTIQPRCSSPQSDRFIGVAEGGEVALDEGKGKRKAALPKKKETGELGTHYTPYTLCFMI